MSKAVLSMSMSLDGFIAGPDDGPGNGLGDGGHRLHEWILTGAEAGHREAVDRLDGVNREVMDEVMSTGAVVVGRRTFEFAGGWGGDHLDELQIHLVPVLFGRGRRLFENMPPDHIELELVRALDGPGVQHLRYRVRTEG